MLSIRAHVFDGPAKVSSVDQMAHGHRCRQRRRNNIIFALIVAALMPGAGQCTSSVTGKLDFDDVTRSAWGLTQSPFNKAEVVPLAAFDPPASGPTGLDYSEYLALVTRRPFFDDRQWWLKQRPRGNVEKQPLDIWYVPPQGTRYRQLLFRESDFVYATTPINPALEMPLPPAARHITALDIGHAQTGQRHWPQVFHIGGNGYSRLSGYSGEFSTSLRFGTHNAGTDHESFPVIRKLYVRKLNSRALALLALIDSEAFTAAVAMRLLPGNTSVLEVRTAMFMRQSYSSDRPGTGPLALSSMFWKGVDATPGRGDDQAHDADTFGYCGPGAIVNQFAIDIPDRSESPSTRDLGALKCFALMQRDRNPAHYAAYAAAKYSLRSSIRVDNITSTVPYAVRFSRFFTDYEGHDNLVVYVGLLGDLRQTMTMNDAIRFNYRVTSSTEP